ncbi:hypothetical protein [Rheinheimera soli]|uniref:hypothetical protein n=1 Tax=Rheinheimera soli TaxID=443616 RepID=UPI001E4732F4|nr:hypothetical protein [Rheinheimera soli]
MDNWKVVAFMLLAWGIISACLIFLFGKLRRRKWRVPTKRCIKRNHHVIGAVLIATLIVPIVAYISKFSANGFSDDPGQWGQMGDFFGGLLNPVLAFASFMALLYTIRIQSEELGMTREELKLTRHELAKSSEANQKSSEVMESQFFLLKEQNFEQLFSKALKRLHGDITQLKNSNFKLSFYYSGDLSGRFYEGREVFKDFKKEDPKGFYVGYNNFLSLFKKKDGYFSNQDLSLGGASSYFTFGHVGADNSSCYYIVKSDSADGLIELVLDNKDVFRGLVSSLYYTLNSLFNLKQHSSTGSDFSLFYYSDVDLAIDDNVLLMLMIICKGQQVIPQNIFIEFKFFERISFDEDGFIAGGLLNVSAIGLPPEAFGFNESVRRYFEKHKSYWLTQQ